MISASKSIDFTLTHEPPASGLVRLALVVFIVVLVHLLAGLILLRKQDAFQMKSEAASATGTPIRVSMVSIARPAQPAPPAQPRQEVKKMPTIVTVKTPALRAVARQEKPLPVNSPIPAQVAPEPAALPTQATEIATQAGATPGPATVATPKNLSAGEFKKLACRIPAPVYPAKARRLHEEGSVALHVQIDTQGNFSQVRVMQGSGFDELDHAALEAVRAGACQPYQEGGIPRIVEANQRIDFTAPD